ncbi:unnamed protein product [Amoebophrya sp. A120]|nr:unnamed protein product [Amoebophrya sp. A120]|eukprot:GSA120T00007184001.1
MSAALPVPTSSTPCPEQQDEIAELREALEDEKAHSKRVEEALVQMAANMQQLQLLHEEASLAHKAEIARLNKLLLEQDENKAITSTTAPPAGQKMTTGAGEENSSSSGVEAEATELEEQAEDGDEDHYPKDRGDLQDARADATTAGRPLQETSDEAADLLHPEATAWRGKLSKFVAENGIGAETVAGDKGEVK